MLPTRTDDPLFAETIAREWMCLDMIIHITQRVMFEISDWAEKDVLEWIEYYEAMIKRSNEPTFS